MRIKNFFKMTVASVKEEDYQNQLCRAHLAGHRFRHGFLRGSLRRRFTF
jgi:hypothetical protein